MSKIASRLIDYHAWVNDWHNMGILISGEIHYYYCLADAFPYMDISNIWEPRREDQKDKYDWGMFINHIQSNDETMIKNFLEYLKVVVFIQSSLLQTFAIDMHTLETGREKTQMGNLVRYAKSYRPHETPNMANVNKLIEIFADFIQKHPSYIRADIIIPVPPSRPDKFNLPSYLSRELANILNKINGEDIVKKVKTTRPMKDLQSFDEKYNEVRGAFEVSQIEAVAGKRVILLDDICQSGATLQEVASVLKQAGATVLGLVATKTLRDAQ